ncbi:MAG: deoxyguanosinetriphosphate triphosphohydrolase [Burkholderiaceae bacterium]|jgi:dGTPase|nr:deoxyguanosinetriphosphate triphosphohydrolase [Burkholderiaceae bacterium]
MTAAGQNIGNVGNSGNVGGGGALACYASHPQTSRGRRHAQDKAPTRNEFQRDRDRIVHSAAFRRLMYKTQVFLNHEGDLFRTRLTHSLEVAQIARSIARPLGLHEDLVEAIALAHDLGHTPFGHAGQDALNTCMAAHGGFEHNLQSLRVVDHLERRYPQHDGLNLTFETREGILKHCAPTNARKLEQQDPGGVAARFLHGGQPALEAQLANLADEIAYNAHDVDDGVRSGLLTLRQLEAVPLLAHHLASVRQDHPALDDRRLLHETIRRMLSHQIYDVIDTTRAALAAAAPASANAVRRHSAPLVQFGAPLRAQLDALKHFLLQKLYRHPQVCANTDLGRRVVRELFAAYCAHPAQMRPQFATRADRERAVADYIAGMTDRFARREHARLTACRLLD